MTSTLCSFFKADGAPSAAPALSFAFSTIPKLRLLAMPPAVPVGMLGIGRLCSSASAVSTTQAGPAEQELARSSEKNGDVFESAGEIPNQGDREGVSRDKQTLADEELAESTTPEQYQEDVGNGPTLAPKNIGAKMGHPSMNGRSEDKLNKLTATSRLVVG